MARKPPDKPEDIFPELVADLQAALGTDLLGVCVYGSAASGRYVRGVSDINLLLLLAERAHHRLRDLLPFCRKWAPARVPPPVVLTPGFVAGSQDVFPIEYLTMAAGHRCLHGQDPLAGLSPNPAFLRLQLERELRAKLMALRGRLLASGGKEEALTALLKEALPAFGALFQAWLQLTSGDFPADIAQALDKMGAQGDKMEAFRALLDLRSGARRARGHELWGLWERSLHELEDLISRVDGLQT